MKANKNIPSCDLVTVYISTDQGPMIGILKMDYVKNFTHQVNFIDEKIGIGIIEHVAALPSTKLKKCAFIKPLRDKQDIDLMVLDKSKGEDEYGSNYFINNYLGCHVIENSRDESKKILSVVEHYTRNVIGDDPEKGVKLREHIKNKMIADDSIEISKVAQEFFEDDEENKQSFNEYIENYGIKQITVDKEYIAKKFKKVRLNLDREIDLYLDFDAYKDKNKFEIVKNGDGTVNVILKQVRSIIEK